MGAGGSLACWRNLRHARQEGAQSRLGAKGVVIGFILFVLHVLHVMTNQIKGNCPPADDVEATPRRLEKTAHP